MNACCLALVMSLLCGGLDTDTPGPSAGDPQIESETIAKVILLGGTVTRDESQPDVPVIGIDFEQSKRLRNGHLHLLRRFPQLKSLNLADSRITDEGLAELQKLPKLARLNLFGTKITDEGLQHVGKLKSLTSLQIGDTLITDVGLRELHGLKNLKSLFVCRTGITDEGLREIAEITSLKMLCLGGSRSRISGHGVAHLVKLTNLKSLSLGDIRPEHEIIDRLKQSNPELEIPSVEDFPSRPVPLPLR